MNVNAFRHFYNYHIAENRKIWERFIVPLYHDQITQHADYSIRSIRDQIIHLMDVDEIWFSELRNIEPPEPLLYTNLDDRKLIRERWDAIEQFMLEYLSELQDDTLFDKPIKEPEEDKDLAVWQVLLHVVNHGTDHRAQLLRLLNDLGVKTTSQDYIFYVYDNP